MVYERAPVCASVFNDAFGPGVAPLGRSAARSSATLRFSLSPPNGCCVLSHSDDCGLSVSVGQRPRKSITTLKRDSFRISWRVWMTRPAESCWRVQITPNKSVEPIGESRSALFRVQCLHRLTPVPYLDRWAEKTAAFSKNQPGSVQNKSAHAS